MKIPRPARWVPADVKSDRQENRGCRFKKTGGRRHETVNEELGNGGFCNSLALGGFALGILRCSNDFLRHMRHFGVF